MAAPQPADSLRNRTFLGLLAAQFLAAFNDQAIHASAMFFAINTNALNEAQAISLMPILFYAPWAVFCTLAGYLADRYSKRASLVGWKIAEVGITLVALAGFWLGTHGQAAGAWLELSTVFLMGTHSAFFVPAKYGAMPEILSPHMLSRGNGVLESLSFLAVILGTVFGGILSQVFGGQEYWIGVVLVVLAVVGALASLLIRPLPAANPTRPFPPYLYRPLWDNVRMLLRSRPLAVAVVGIAFFTFLVAFMRATVYMHGESHVPRWSESHISLVVGMVALGIGLGSPLVGFLSGGKVELGLVPVGAVGMIVATAIAAAFLGVIQALVACIIAIGFFTGFYIVPLFTLLQHRAPKTSKGDAVATSNFINVTGAIVASLLFFVLVWAAQQVGLAPELPQQEKWHGVLREVQYLHGRPHRVVIRNASLRILQATDEGPKPAVIEVDENDLIDAFSTGLKVGEKVVETRYKLGGVTHHRLRRAGEPQRPVYDNSRLPRLLFAGAGLMTLLTLLLLWRLLPDLFLRSRLWLYVYRRCRLEVAGINHVSGDGPVILATNAADAGSCLQVLAATDRTTRLLLPPAAPDEVVGGWLLAWAGRLGLGRLGEEPTRADLEKAAERAEAALARGEAVALSLGGGAPGRVAEQLLENLGREWPVPVVPVWHAVMPTAGGRHRPRAWVVAGEPLPPGTSAQSIRERLDHLGAGFRQSAGDDLTAEAALSGAS
jgi:MFS family permease